MKFSRSRGAVCVALLSIPAPSTASSGPYPDCVNGPLKSNKVCDATASPADRASALVAVMTADEKLKNIIRYVMAAFEASLTNVMNDNGGFHDEG